MHRVIAALFVIVLSAGTALAQQPQAARPVPPSAGASTWLVDSGHSAAGFSVKHMMVSTVRGALGSVSGTVDYDGRNVASVKADITIDVKAINTGNASRDKDLRSDGFFEVEKFPTMTFKSKRAEPADAGRFRLVGDLTMRGVTKEVTLDVEGPSPAIRTQNGGSKVGATATTKLNRRDFGLNYNRLIEAGAVVGDEVTVTIDIELSRPN
jgi:polyisoprenoid-binding protein YceI